ncbi:MAG: cob(I)yrinic acid a,c-diamide adenosyltransferase [Candidatus Cloacimonetes bacterium]|nr:cob(I)yrinic acid a,c-diamide adenosyltransferase [Candidatus Cloacimonadota bacterium]
MSITTKTGDQGTTSLYSGECIGKGEIRVESYGTLDELDAHIGEARHYIEPEEIRQILTDLQNRLSRSMGELASISQTYPYPICLKDVDELTALVYRFEAEVDLSGFVIPGMTLASAKLDICRTIARRAERRIAELAQKEPVPPEIQQFVNRLSDLFYIMARRLEQHCGVLTYKTKPDEPGCER